MDSSSDARCEMLRQGGGWESAGSDSTLVLHINQNNFVWFCNLLTGREEEWKGTGGAEGTVRKLCTEIMKRTNEVKFKWLHTSRRLLNHLFSPNCTLEWTPSLPTPPQSPQAAALGKVGVLPRVRELRVYTWLNWAWEAMLTFWHCPPLGKATPHSSRTPFPLPLLFMQLQLYFHTALAASGHKKKKKNKREGKQQKFLADMCVKWFFIQFPSTRVFVTINENQL